MIEGHAAQQVALVLVDDLVLVLDAAQLTEDVVGVEHLVGRCGAGQARGLVGVMHLAEQVVGRDERVLDGGVGALCRAIVV